MSSDDNDYTIRDEDQYHKTLTALSRQDRPNFILRKLMNAFESYRQSRKIGWSRPWNKYDLNNFQSFKLNFSDDGALVEDTTVLIQNAFTQQPSEAREFIDDLVADHDSLMGFVFVHEYEKEGRHFEGATVSLGRKREKRYRDRLDLILESEIINGESQGLSRMRLYVDPYDPQRREPLYSTVLEDGLGHPAQALFARLSALSWEWAGRPEKVWDHWTSSYIDYFGPRRFALSRSYFHLPEHPQGRLQAA